MNRFSDAAVISRPWFGVLNVSKPAGLTSRDVVNRVQRLVRPAKCGHAGTLDPMATGVLLVCVGPATRLVNLLQEGRKTYVAEFTLGCQSDTDDSTGQVTVPTTDPVIPTLSQITQGLQQQTGSIQQVPPAFSAVHVNGERAYKAARQGRELTLTAKTVNVHRISVLNYSWPHLELEIECGSGTYIRSIARDLGSFLGCGALMSRLERTRIGAFSLTDAVSPDHLSAENLVEQLHDPGIAVSHLFRYPCHAEDLRNLRQGRQISFHRSRVSQQLREQVTAADSIAIVTADAESLVAIGKLTDCGSSIQPSIVFPIADELCSGEPTHSGS